MKINRRAIIGVACGCVAAVLTFIYVSDVRAQALTAREDAIERYGGESVEVCVAKRDIAVGESIEDSDVALEVWLVDLLPEGAFVDTASVVGQTAQTAIADNEPITAAKIGDAIREIDVPDGLCAVSIPSEDVLAVGGAIKGGSLVNVYSAGSDSVDLIGEGILVLETSNSTAASENSGSIFGNAATRASLSWVTLAIAPDSVEQLIAASRSKSLYLVLPGSSSQSSLPDEGDGGDDE